MAERTVSVEVVYAGTSLSLVSRVEVASGSTVMQAIQASGIAGRLPEGSIDPARLGIFSRRVASDCIVQDGDRIEIYRPLLLDPMEARRRRAR